MEVLIVLVVLGALTYALVKKYMESQREWICTQCKSIGTAKTKYGGS